MPKNLVVRDERGRMLGDPKWGALPSGHASVALRVSAPVDVVRAFEQLSPRQRGAVLEAWHATRKS